MEKNTIKKNFSRYAGRYDGFSGIQDRCAEYLIEKVDGVHFNSILDIGCGTGNYTRHLRKKFPLADIKALDISSEMIRVARKKLEGKDIEFITGDAEELNLAGGFDLVSSNATFHWFTNLDATFLRYKDILNKNGEIIFTIFGPGTFCELNYAVREYFGGGESIYSCRFIEGDSVKKILSRHFKDINVERRILKEDNSSLSGLLEKIRYTGTRGNGTNGKGIWTKRTIDKLQKIYKDK
ncbi:MAG: methyltransferase domain-containing protein, partial [Candidatus Omnitrophica bacterium]|nr:methyltransferase domain-containing protein [Candidatus Omnitrophota bacterium]